MAPSVLFSGVWVEPIHKHQTVDTGTIFEVKAKRGGKSKEREGKKGNKKERTLQNLGNYFFHILYAG